MTGFAGSRSLDERRRRRLATESEEAVVEAVAATPSKTAATKRIAADKTASRKRGPSHFPLRKLISSRLWKLAGVSFWGLLVGAGILIGGWAAAEYPERLGPGFVRLFNLQEGRLVRCYLSTAMFLTSQLALLIWWLRSLSLRDFDGRYRGWVFCAMVGFGTAFAIQTDIATAWSETVGWLWPVEFWNKSILTWMAPAAVCGFGIVGFLHREMRDSRFALAMLWLATLIVFGLAIQTLTGPLPLSPLMARLIVCGLAMLGALCLCVSCLFHARNVVYISVEPPADRPSRLWGLLRRLSPRSLLSLARRFAPAAAKSTTATAKRPRRKTASRPKRSKVQTDSGTEREAPPADSATSPASPRGVHALKDPALAGQRPLRRSA